jgi:hypothetical protein
MERRLAGRAVGLTDCEGQRHRRAGRDTRGSGLHWDAPRFIPSWRAPQFHLSLILHPPDTATLVTG